MKFNMLLKKLDSISEKESDIMIFFVVCFTIGIFSLRLGLHECFVESSLGSKVIPSVVGAIFMLLSVAAFVIRNYQ